MTSLRKIPDPLVVQTLFGPEVATKTCNACREEKFVHQFYCETPTKLNKFKRYGEQVRNQCIDCWSIYQGRTWLLNYK